MKKKVSVARVLIVAALILYTVFLFFPIITILLTSFVPSNELATNTGFVWWPKEFTFDAYKTIFEYDSYVDMVGMPGLLLGLFNTLWLTLIPLLVGLVVAGFSAYAFSKMNFPFKEKLFKFSVIIRSVPLGAFAVISYIFYSAIGWTGERGMLPLLIPGMFGSIGTMFFLRLFFDGIPNSLIEAATLDGAGFFQCFFKILFPLAKPAFIAQFIFGFVGGYNSYLAPMLYLQNEPKFVTLQLYLSQIRSLFPTAGSENIYCAAAILGMLPLVIIYCCMQKYFIEGVSAGGVKE
jgi:multiple sugar transport system permease protein